MEDRRAGDRSSPCTQRLGLIDFLEKSMNTCDFRGCAFLNSLVELPDANHPMRREIVFHKRSLLERIRQLVDAHFIDRSDVERGHLAASIFTSFEGALVLARTFRETWPITTSRQQVKAML